MGDTITELGSEISDSPELEVPEGLSPRSRAAWKRRMSQARSGLGRQVGGSVPEEEFQTHMHRSFGAYRKAVESIKAVKVQRRIQRNLTRHKKPPPSVKFEERPGLTNRDIMFLMQRFPDSDPSDIIKLITVRLA
eukprot:scaffold156578_cov37-Prasinocladus_malaysianus.AAC.1